MEKVSVVNCLNQGDSFYVVGDDVRIVYRGEEAEGRLHYISNIAPYSVLIDISTTSNSEILCIDLNDIESVESK